MASVREIQSKVCFNQTPFENINRLENSCQRIAALWNEFQKRSSDPERGDIADASLLGRLGIAESDSIAKKTLLPIMQMALRPDVEIKPSRDDSGVYFLSIDGTKFAVFKVGAKRLRMEQLARSIAHKLGLEKHAIPGVAITISNPKFIREETDEELWNGNVMVYRSDRDDDYNRVVRDRQIIVTGILEPYIDKDLPITAEEFASFTAFALFAGLRDGKLSGMAGPMSFDLEEIMPMSHIPNTKKTPNKHVAAIHLPLLEHEYASTDISESFWQEIALNIQKHVPKLFSFLSELENEPVMYADFRAESLVPEDIDTPAVGVNDGNCPVEVEISEMIMDEHPQITVRTLNDPLLHSKQLIAATQRIGKLLEVLQKVSSPMSPIDLVRSVDPFYDAHWKALKRDKYDRHPRAHVIGRITPQSCSRLFQDDREALIAQSKSPPPTLIPFNREEFEGERKNT